MSILHQKILRPMLTVALAALIVLIVAACDAGTGTTQTSTPTSTSKIQKNSGGGYVAPQTAVLSWNPQTDQLTVTTHITGLTPNTTHPYHIHVGTCAKGGDIKYPLRDITADMHGNALTDTVVPGITTGILATGWHLMIHHGPGLLTSDQAAPIYCGDIINSNHLKVVTVKLEPMTSMKMS